MAVRTSLPQLLQQLMLRQQVRVVVIVAETVVPVVMATVALVVTTTSNLIKNYYISAGFGDFRNRFFIKYHLIVITMKRIISAAFALLALAACGSSNTDEEITAYKDACRAFSEKAESQLSADITDEEWDSTYNALIAEYAQMNRSFIKKNRNNRLAVIALKEAVDNECFDPDEIRRIVDSLHDTLKTNPDVVRILDRLDVLERTAVGCKFTDFEVDGVKFSDFVGKGKYVLVDFWASWCGPCKAEIPNIKAVYEKYHGKDFDVLSVAVWDKPEDTVASAKEHGIVWNQIINAQRIPTDLYGINGIPTIMLIGPDGTILDRTMRGEQIMKVVSEHLGR